MSGVICCAASMALALVESLPSVSQWMHIDRPSDREVVLTVEESGEGHGLFVASDELDDGEIVKKAIACVRKFGPRGITTKAPKNKDRRKMASHMRPADADTRLQVRIARSGVRHGGDRIAVAAPFTVSMVEPAIGYARFTSEGKYPEEGSARQPRADIRFLQLVRDTGELLVSQAWRRTNDTGFVKPHIHLATAVLLRRIGLADPQPPTDAIRCMAQMLVLFVWALERCMHADIVSRSSANAMPRHKACALAVARAWELFFFCRRHGWADNAGVEEAYMSVLACLPRALLQHEELYDDATFAACLQGVKIRPRSAADANEPATPTEVRWSTPGHAAVAFMC